MRVAMDVGCGVIRPGEPSRRSVKPISSFCQRGAESSQFGARKIPHFGGGGDQPLA